MVPITSPLWGGREFSSAARKFRVGGGRAEWSAPCAPTRKIASLRSVIFRPPHKGEVIVRRWSRLLRPDLRVFLDQLGDLVLAVGAVEPGLGGLQRVELARRAQRLVAALDRDEHFERAGETRILGLGGIWLGRLVFLLFHRAAFCDGARGFYQRGSEMPNHMVFHGSGSCSIRWKP